MRVLNAIISGLFAIAALAFVIGIGISVSVAGAVIGGFLVVAAIVVVIAVEIYGWLSKKKQ